MFLQGSHLLVTEDSQYFKLRGDDAIATLIATELVRYLHFIVLYLMRFLLCAI
jgi:hypothetical protein